MSISYWFCTQLYRDLKCVVLIFHRENEIEIGLRFLIPKEHRQKVFRNINYQTTDYDYSNRVKSKENDNQHMMPLVNILKQMDSVINSFKTSD